MTAEIYLSLFVMLGVYVVASVWQRTAEERRLCQRARDSERAALRRDPASTARGTHGR